MSYVLCFHGFTSSFFFQCSWLYLPELDVSGQEKTPTINCSTAITQPVQPWQPLLILSRSQAGAGRHILGLGSPSLGVWDKKPKTCRGGRPVERRSWKNLLENETCTKFIPYHAGYHRDGLQWRCLLEKVPRIWWQIANGNFLHTCAVSRFQCCRTSSYLLTPTFPSHFPRKPGIQTAELEKADSSTSPNAHYALKFWWVSETIVKK